MRKVSVSEFRARGSRLIEDAAAKCESFELTSRGKVIAVVEPVRTYESADWTPGAFDGEVRIVGDILSPILPLEEWNLDESPFPDENAPRSNA